MSGLATLHEDARKLSALTGYGVRQAGIDVLLTDAQVVAATTVADLIANVEAAVVHEEFYNQKLQTIKALRVGAMQGEYSDARIQAATTVAGLALETWLSQSDADLSHIGVPMTE